MRCVTAIGFCFLLTACVSCSETGNGTMPCQGFGNPGSLPTNWSTIISRNEGGMALDVVAMCVNARQYYFAVVPTSGVSFHFTIGEIERGGYASPEHLANDVRRWWAGDVETGAGPGANFSVPPAVDVRPLTTAEIERLRTAMNVMER